MMSLNLTNANASLSPHAIRNSNAASVPSASFLRKQSCFKYFDGLEQNWGNFSNAVTGVLCWAIDSFSISFRFVWFCFTLNDAISVTWWRHQIETFSMLWPFVRGIHWSPVNSPHKSQWRGALMFSFIYVWIDGWVNNPEAGDLRHHHAHYDVIVINQPILVVWLPQCKLPVGCGIWDHK